ncbi:winged helix-turn-helix domain-containing protein [Celerinatantimonas diazotrophica]|uniref:winged helix-turn-helix domain-containing protein n=1 Tax=Celerinatantimonas diazotrophica TaxID=412034 RepID=UPI00104A619A|nr:winged helix-turn-helix domain-containing protein [Celerinatantimonas diazotrophica]CAG9295025.1 hypothetical protein CEDIAZO_00131 [Celerinatantimonas diazotrophica]
MSCLNTRANAYISKSADQQELIAIMRSLYRHITSSDTITHRNYRLCADKRSLILNNNSHIDLTATEGIVLHALAQSAPEALSPRHLTEALGCNYLYYNERKLETTISRLRRKMKKLIPEKDAIKAARGRSYQLLLPVATDSTSNIFVTTTTNYIITES